MTGLPLFDFVTLTSETRADNGQLAAFAQACAVTGVFQLAGHGVPDSLAAALQTQMRRFFAQPQAVKRQIARSASNVWGFNDAELTKNRQDRKEVFDVGPLEPLDSGSPLAGATPQWPEAPEGFREVVTVWQLACESLSLRLLEVVARAFGEQPDQLRADFMPDHTSFLRLNHYPVVAPDIGLGIHPHTDAGALTLLLQDEQPGLEVLLGDTWVLVPPVPGALTVNIGDVVQVWSNDRWPAPVHRVQPSLRRTRYSAAYFFNPAYRANYAPLPGLSSEQQQPRYRPINWGAFRAGRAAGDYADQGEEIQISQFRLPGQP